MRATRDEKVIDRLKGAPIPVTGNTGSNLGILTEIGLESRSARALTGLEILGGLRVLIALGVDGALNLVQAVGTSLLPALESTPAEVTGSGENTLGVEAGILVERHKMRGVVVAEDVTAVAAVMTAGEEAEGRAASGRITARRSSVSL